MTTDRLAALLEEALEANGVSLGQRSRYESIATRLAAAGVTVAQPDEDEHRYVEMVDADGDDWYGCICGCYLAHPAPDPLREAAEVVVGRFLDTPASLAGVHVAALNALRAALTPAPKETDHE